jgi:threonine/homoserine/homoserine lactone efflux protein
MVTAGALAIGVGLGAATGVPLGVVNLAIVEAATRVGRRHAIGIGLGGALADMVHAGIAFAGAAPLLTRHAAIARGFHAASGLAVLVYAILLWRREATATASQPSTGGLARGIVVGASLTLPNTAALAAWLAVAGAVFPDATVATGLVAAAGVGLGSAAWFAALAHVAAGTTVRTAISTRARRGLAIALGILGAASIARSIVS